LTFYVLERLDSHYCPLIGGKFTEAAAILSKLLTSINAQALKQATSKHVEKPWPDISAGFPTGSFSELSGERYTNSIAKLLAKQCYEFNCDFASCNLDSDFHSYDYEGDLELGFTNIPGRSRSLEPLLTDGGTDYTNHWSPKVPYIRDWNNEARSVFYENGQELSMTPIIAKAYFEVQLANVYRDLYQTDRATKLYKGALPILKAWRARPTWVGEQSPDKAIKTALANCSRALNQTRNPKR
jgi:hypothetical protein